MFRRVLIAATGSVTIAWLFATTALACSPPFEEPTIRALGPAQVVVVGTIGERVEGGRLFHVQRSYNGGVTGTPILIAFKEGEPVGDCSYPVSTGAVLIIAPYGGANGRLSADLSTLQADPATPVGQRYVAEATELFGPGFIPETVRAAPDVAPEAGTSPDVRPVLAVLAGGGVALFAVIDLIARRRPPG